MEMVGLGASMCACRKYQIVVNEQPRWRELFASAEAAQVTASRHAGKAGRYNLCEGWREGGGACDEIIEM
jgi:hypothetical protein